jgi:mannose-1-phosphate guanylyltransferase
MRTVILAGGFGTRLAEETDCRPKPMVEIGGPSSSIIPHTVSRNSTSLWGTGARSSSDTFSTIPS